MAHTQTTQIAKEATFVRMNAKPGKERLVIDLLKSGAEMVRKTEPLTLQWMALQESHSRFAIADFFPDAKGREAHFAGMVAEALKNSAAEMVEGGWENGVVPNVEDSKVLSSSISDSHYSMARIAMRIEFQAKPGKAEALEKLLIGAAEIVEGTEPETLLWYAVRLAPDRFAILDVFPNETAKMVHLTGKVAALLKTQSEELIHGGWDKGVAPNVRNYLILSCTY